MANPRKSHFRFCTVPVQIFGSECSVQVRISHHFGHTDLPRTLTGTSPSSSINATEKLQQNLPAASAAVQSLQVETTQASYTRTACRLCQGCKQSGNKSRTTLFRTKFGSKKSSLDLSHRLLSPTRFARRRRVAAFQKQIARAMCSRPSIARPSRIHLHVFNLRMEFIRCEGGVSCITPLSRPSRRHHQRQHHVCRSEQLA